MKRDKVFLDILFIAFIFVCPLSAFAENEVSDTALDEFEVGKYQYCGNDSDCMPALNGCCPCAAGGHYVAVNKDRFKDFQARFSCLKVTCHEAEEESCGDGVVSCVFHKCKYTSREEAEKK